MDAAEFAGWAWAIIGVVIGGAIAVYVVVVIVRAIRDQKKPGTTTVNVFNSGKGPKP